MERASLRVADTLRATTAGAEAAKVALASVSLFEAGGKRVLSASTQRGLRKVAEASAHRVLAAVSAPLVDTGARATFLAEAQATATLTPALATEAGVALGVGAARAAAKQILKGASKAAGVGFVIDGAVAGFEATLAVRRGRASRGEAIKHVAVEATTGALATGAGVLVGAGLVALTGGMAAPVVFAASALGAIASKRALRQAASTSGWSRSAIAPADLG